MQLIVGEQIVTDGCKTIEFQGKTICCAWKLEVVVKNCGEFLVYRLGPTGFCPSAYCVKGKWFASFFFDASNTTNLFSLDEFLSDKGISFDDLLLQPVKKWLKRNNLHFV